MFFDRHDPISRIAAIAKALGMEIIDGTVGVIVAAADGREKKLKST